MLKWGQSINPSSEPQPWSYTYIYKLEHLQYLVSQNKFHHFVFDEYLEFDTSY